MAFGVVPYFNTQSGLMASVRNLLYDTQARVCADVNLTVTHHLMAKGPLSEVGRSGLPQSDKPRPVCSCVFSYHLCQSSLSSFVRSPPSSLTNTPLTSVLPC